MTSKLGILFQEARNTVKVRRPVLKEGERALAVEWLPPGRIENYLTELLSLLIRVDAQPMLKLLKPVDVLKAVPAPRLRADTQRGVIGTDLALSDRARIDLVLAVDGEREDVAEIWVEVKAGSPFTGDQVPRYLRAIKDAKDRVPRRLVILGSAGDCTAETHHDGEPVITVTWADLASLAAQSSALWKDFAIFLRERGVVGGDGGAPPPRGLPDEWLAEAIASGLEATVAWCKWPKGRSSDARRRSVLAALGASRTGGRYVRIWAPGQLTYIDIGACDEPDSVSVRLALPASWVIAHGVLRRRAHDSLLAKTGWRLGKDRDADVVLSISQPFSTDTTSIDGAVWIRTQIAALERAEMLVDLDGNGAARAVSV